MFNNLSISELPVTGTRGPGSGRKSPSQYTKLSTHNGRVTIGKKLFDRVFEENVYNEAVRVDNIENKDKRKEELNNLPSYYAIVGINENTGNLVIGFSQKNPSIDTSKLYTFNVAKRSFILPNDWAALINQAIGGDFILTMIESDEQVTGVFRLKVDGEVINQEFTGYELVEDETKRKEKSTKAKNDDEEDDHEDDDENMESQQQAEVQSEIEEY